LGAPEPPDRIGFVDENEVIVAVQYRKVLFRWFSPRTMENAYLESGQNVWDVFGFGRDPTEPWVLEATLEEIRDGQEIIVV
jgi:hypothetical protein